MARYILSTSAEADLDEIASFIAVENFNAAMELILRFEARFQMLAEYPKAGRDRSEIDFGLRSLVDGRYVIFYEESEDGVLILRVVHSARDIDSQFH